MQNAKDIKPGFDCSCFTLLGQSNGSSTNYVAMWLCDFQGKPQFAIREVYVGKDGTWWPGRTGWNLPVGRLVGFLAGIRSFRNQLPSAIVGTEPEPAIATDVWN